MKRRLFRSTIALLALFCFSTCYAAPPYRIDRALITVSAEAAQEEPAPLVIPHLKLQGVIDDTMSNNVLAAFAAIEITKPPAVLFEIDSPGGSVAAGFAIAKAIEESSVPVICVVDGSAYSMAFYVLQSCDIRSMTDRSVLMAHEPSVMTIVNGKAANWRKLGIELSQMLEALTKAMNHHCSRRLNISYEDYSKRVYDTEWQMASEEALSVAAVDHVVISVREVQNIMAATFK